MELNFITDPELVPRPREEIRIEALSLTPYEDGRRIRVNIKITPFSPFDRPNLEITAFDPAGDEIASMSVIGSIHHALELTMHLRRAKLLPGSYTFQVDLFYDREDIQHTASGAITLPVDPRSDTPE